MGRGTDRRFRNRREAGRGLGDELSTLGLERPLVLALPRGGVPIGVEVAEALDAPLDVLVARKVTPPDHAEFAIGALAEGTDRVVLHSTAAELGLTQDELDRAIDQTRREVARRAHRYRGGRPLPDLTGRVGVIVDDGLATGATAEAAILAVKETRATDVVVAVPVGAADTVARLAGQARVVCLSAPERFSAVGLWYDDFAQLTDDEVLAALSAAR